MGKNKSGYIAAVLSPEAHEALATLAIHPVVHAHHNTIFFKPAKAGYEETWGSLLGQTVTLRVTGMIQDERGQAVVLEPLSLPSNRRAHVTVSCAEGTKPVYSNSLLESGEILALEMELEAVLEFIHF